jgi:ABC-type sugar transport system substrate-binding protein
MKKTIIAFLSMTILMLSSCIKPEKAQQPELYKDNTVMINEENKVAYLCRDASDLWLMHIANGIKDACDELGVEFILVNCKDRDDLFLSFFKDLEDTKLSALIVSPTSEGLGPMITSKCSEAGIPLLCIESRLKTTEGKNAAYIGASAYECGMIGGQELAERVLEGGFLESGKPLTVIMLSRSNFFYEDQMMKGFQDALKILLPDLREENYIQLETYRSRFESQYHDIKNRLKELNHNSWYIGVSYNDEGALALYQFACESGIDLDNMYICSKGGYDPAYNIFDKDGQGAVNYITIGVNPFEIGQKAVYSLYSYIHENKQLPEMHIVESTLVTSENYKEYFHQIYGNKLTTDMMKYFNAGDQEADELLFKGPNI